ncbi:MAG: sensor histidine kinase, partial [Ignavibacteriales bacterium]|nr:sensor histidine kinase [Ignavibacteriales bacterium]
ETIRHEAKIIAVFDAQYMRHAIGHLVRNAIAFSSSGTFVTVAAARRDSMLFFSVTDQGQGIPASEIPSLFKDFARISVRPTGGEHTTRLGLGIVRRIVEAHGGTTHVQSVPQQGSTFTIQLPWKEHVTEQ